MITIGELQNAFTFEFESDTDELTYRKYTTDSIPEYVLRLDNSLQEYYIRAFPTVPDYMTLVYYDTNRPVSFVEGVLIEPNASTRLLVTFDLDVLNESDDVTPLISFRLQGMEEVDVPDGQTPTPTPTPTPAPYVGGTTTGGPSLPPPEQDGDDRDDAGLDRDALIPRAI